MDRLELIRLICDVITEIDVLRSDFRRGTKKRERLDDIRAELDFLQRKLVRHAFADNTEEFQTLTTSLDQANAELRQTINDVNRVADTLESLVKFVGVVQKVVGLIP